MYAEQIQKAREQGHTDEQIVGWLGDKSKLAPRVTKALKAGHEPQAILSYVAKMPNREFVELDFVARNPNLYGLYGATVETAKAVIPYVKYIDPAERDKFMKLSQQRQTRDLLLNNLGAVAVLGAGPITKGAAPIIKRYLPRTYKLLTKKRSILRVFGKKPIPKVPPKVEPRIQRAAEARQAEITRLMPEEPIGPKPEIPTKKTLRVEEQKQVIGKMIKEGIIDRDKPSFSIRLNGLCIT